MKKDSNLIIINNIKNTFIDIIKYIRDNNYKNGLFKKILSKIKFISFKSNRLDIYKNLIIDLIKSLPTKKQYYNFDYKIWNLIYKDLKKDRRIMRNKKPFNYNKITNKLGHIWNGIISLYYELNKI